MEGRQPPTKGTEAAYNPAFLQNQRGKTSSRAARDFVPMEEAISGLQAAISRLHKEWCTPLHGIYFPSDFVWASVPSILSPRRCPLLVSVTNNQTTSVKALQSAKTGCTSGSK